MNDNNYVLLPQVKIGFIYNNIQTVVPFVLDESLDVYNLLKKLVDYCNELGARSNELQYILKDLVDFLNNKLNEQRDYINEFLTNLHQEWVDYKDSLEDRYDEFTQKVDELFETYKEQIRDEYNTELSNIRTNNETLYNNLKSLLDEKIKELTDYANNIEPNIDDYIDEKDQAIRELITNFQNEFTEYQKTVNNDLIELGDTLTELINTNEQNVINQINSKTEEIITSLGSVNMQELIGEKLNSYNSEELGDLFTNLYGSLIRITYMDTNTPPTVVSETPIYHYNPDTGVLTDCTTGNEALILSNSLYLYNGRLFYPLIDIMSREVDTSEKTDNKTLSLVGYNEDLTVALLMSNDENAILYKLDTIQNKIFNTGITLNGDLNYHNFIAMFHEDIYYTHLNNLYKYNNETKIFETVDISSINTENENVYVSVCNDNLYLFIDEHKLYRYDNNTFTYIMTTKGLNNQVLDDTNGYIVGRYGLQINYYDNDLTLIKSVGDLNSNAITENNKTYFINGKYSIYNDTYYEDGFYKNFINGLILQIHNGSANIGLIVNDNFTILKTLRVSGNYYYTYTINGKVYTSDFKEVILITKLQEIPYQRSDS